MLGFGEARLSRCREDGTGRAGFVAGVAYFGGAWLSW